MRTKDQSTSGYHLIEIENKYSTAFCARFLTGCFLKENNLNNARINLEKLLVDARAFSCFSRPHKCIVFLLVKTIFYSVKNIALA